MKTLVYGLTFHRAHNFGSVLQAYALSQFIEQIGRNNNRNIEYRIIDYFPPNQKELYDVLHKPLSFKAIVKNILSLRYLPSLKKRYKSFEDFVESFLNTTRPYNSSSEIYKEPPIVNYYVCGSDQIWNVRAADFSWVYLLDFAPKDSVRISYAPSLGPKPIDWSLYDAQKYSTLISRFNNLSVREEGSEQNLISIAPNSNVDIMIDPTLLISSDEWKKIETSSGAEEKKPYLLLYCLEPTRRQLALARAIGKKLHHKVIILRYNNKNDWFNRFEKRYSAGPRDFLSYIHHASLILTTSFHGTAFSLIYNKPFYVLDSDKDLRISDLLRRCGLTDRMINSDDVDISMPDFNISRQYIEESKQLAEVYLKKALML